MTVGTSCLLSRLLGREKNTVVRDRRRVREDRAALLVCAVISVIYLLICTRSSPLYPLNDWVDSNCFFTVGKSMFNGRVLYRDIYEQKGFLLYLIHGLGYLISNTTFLGVFLFECLSFCVFLYLVYLSARLYVGYALSLAVLPVVSHSVLTAVSLRQGDSAEQLCLPFVMYAIYAFLKSIRTGDCSGIPDTSTIFRMGMCAACILWIKYTLLGIYIGYVAVALILCLSDKDPLRLCRCAVYFALGALLVSLPVLLYFALNGALGDMYQAYFYNNMFLYTGNESTFTDKLAGVFSLAVRGLSYNGLWGTLVYLGLFSLVSDIRTPRAALGGVVMYFSAVFFIYWGGIGWYYYSLGMAALSVPGFICVLRIIRYVYMTLRRAAEAVYARIREWRLRGAESGRTSVLDSWARAAIVYVCTFATVGSMTAIYATECYADSPNVFYMKYTDDQVWQKQFAEIINESEDKTLLNYSCLDLGLYTTANIVPTEKYFCRLNIGLEEMNESLTGAIREKRCEFVLVRGAPSRFVLYYYDLVASADSHVEFEGSEISYHLLRRKK